MSAALGEKFGEHIGIVTTNAGPNSGHTAYIDGKKVVTHQIPISWLAARCEPTAFLNAGSVIDDSVLHNEMEEHDTFQVLVHPNAAWVSVDDRHQNADISSTGAGTGPSLIRKLSRIKDGIYGDNRIAYTEVNFQDEVILMEVAQGFSLGINQQFYPYCTVRECTPAQGIADLGVSPKRLRKSIVVLRTYPIRTGSLPRSTSGPCYPDQKELEWRKDLGLEPEYATTTGRMRRVFSWSWQQFEDMLRATEPDALFLNFCNYRRYWELIVTEMLARYIDILGHNPDFILTGWGPRAEDIKLWQP